MKQLSPIATAATRHLFIDPIIYSTWDITGEGYVNKEETSFLKPGKIPNLMKLCMPEGVRYSITEEPDPENMFISDLMIGFKSKNGVYWEATIRELNVQLVADGPAQYVFKGPVTIEQDNLSYDDEWSSPVLDNDELTIELDVHYARGTRTLTISSPGTYDNNQPVLYGLQMDLTWKDSKIV